MQTSKSDLDNTDRVPVSAAAGDRGVETADPSDYEHAPQMYVGVLSPSFVHVGMKDRADFDKIAADCDTIDNENGTILIKAVQQPGGVRVIFQYWQKSLRASAFIRRRQQQRAGE